jgi:hypothetical protein
MNTTLGGANVAFGEMTCTGARALTGSNQYGAAMCVQNAGVLSIGNVDFEDLRATYYGGAVYASGMSGSVTVTDCDFENITAGSSGGAVYASGNSGNVTITNCDFENITAGNNGGAVSTSGSGGTISITNCDFKNTRATSGDGGAVSATSSNISVTITNCGFENITGGNRGGAVYASGNYAVITIKDCGFENITTGYNGAVYVNSGGVTITGCGFENITKTAVLTSGSGSVTIMNSDFKNITDGGAVYAFISSGNVAITDCDIENTTTGGAVYVTTSSGSGSNITITDVSVTNSTGAFLGGGIYASIKGGTLAIHNYTSTHTRATSTGGSGGSIYIHTYDGAAVTITNASISDSEAFFDGGGIFIDNQSPSVLSTAVFSNVTFTNVRALSGGAVSFNAFYQPAALALTMNNCSIVSAAASMGGAVEGAGPSSCVFNGVSFQGFSAPQGSLLYGNSNGSGAPAYKVGPGCYINGTPVNVSTFPSFLPLCYLVNGATIAPAF